MLEILKKCPGLLFLLLLLAVFTVCEGASELDKTRYIGLDEIKPTMEAYCLAGYEGTKIEKFDLEILDVVRDIFPGKDAILVKGTDERFIHSGPVAGFSGSPVYIDGRLAGALAFGWAYSKDALYGVTTIEDMLEVGGGNVSGQKSEKMGFGFDFSRPIEFGQLQEQMTKGFSSRQSSKNGMTALRCPLVVSGLPVQVCERLNEGVGQFGLMAVSGLSGKVDPNEARNVRLEPGASLNIPVVSGDIKMEVIGTVTEVIGDDVYGFGHGFLEYGSVDLPMGTGKVHTVVSTLAKSFKLGSMIEIVGAITNDQSNAVRGKIGAKAKLIPLTIKVSRYNESSPQVYNCQLAVNRLLTPFILAGVLEGVAMRVGQLPPDNMVEYKATIGIEDGDAITFENVSTRVGLGQFTSESMVTVAMLLNNPYKEVDIKSLDFEMNIIQKNIFAVIWSVGLSDSKVKAGEQIDIDVILETVRAGRRKYQFSLEVPKDLAPGSYKLHVMGGYAYEKFLRKRQPYKFMAYDLTSLLEALNTILTIDKDKLYCILELPASGISIERAQLPDLPATKALIFQDDKRMVKTTPYQHWIEKSMKIDRIIFDKKELTITVED